MNAPLPGQSMRQYLTASEVAALMYVSPKTVSRWSQEGRIPHVRTLGGHRRYEPEVIRQLIAEQREAAQVRDA